MSDPFSQSLCSGVYSLENLGTRLHDAASHGRKRKVKKIIKRGVPVDFQDQQGRTALYCACLAAQEHVVSWLLKKGADPNLRTLEGATCAHAAACSGNIHVLEDLIKASADLRLHDQDGLTVYDWAYKQPDKRRQTHMLAFIEKMRAVAKTQSGRDLLLQRQSSTYYNSLTNSSSTSLGRLFHHRAAPKPTARSLSVHSLGYGRVYAGEGRQTGMISTIPLVAESCLFHDKYGHSYNNGPFMVMESMNWKQTFVTVKRLHRTPPEGGHVDLLITENKYMAQLRHPHILLLLGVCQTNNLDNLVLLYEPVLCGSLYNFLHQRLETLALWNLCDLMRQICGAVLYLHDNQLVHCTISSHSIHLVMPTLAKLGNLEYMVQKCGRDGGYCHTDAACNKYTDFIYNWLAPEIMSGEPPTELSDVYGLCAVLWEVLHGSLPWHGLNADQIEHEVVQEHNCLPLCHEKVESPFDVILHRGLSVIPDSRILSVDKLRHHMSRIVVDGDHLNLSHRAVMSCQGAPVEVVERSLTANHSEDQTDFSLTRLLENSMSSIPCNTPTPKPSKRAKSSTPARRVSRIHKQEYPLETASPKVADVESPKSGVVIYDSRPPDKPSSKQNSQAPVSSNSGSSQTFRPPRPISPQIVDMHASKPLCSTMVSPSGFETSSHSAGPLKSGRITLEVRREHLFPKEASIECQYPSVFQGLMADAHPKSVSYCLDTSRLSTGTHASQSSAATRVTSSRLSAGAHASQSSAATRETSALHSGITQTASSSASARKALFQAPMPYRRKVYAAPVGSSITKVSRDTASTTDTSSGSLQPMPRLTSDSQTQSSGGNTSANIPTKESPVVMVKFSTPQNAASAHQPATINAQPEDCKSPGEDNPFRSALLTAEDENAIRDLATLKQPRLCSRIASITNELTKKAKQHKHDLRQDLSKQTVFGTLSQPDSDPVVPVRRKSVDPTSFQRQHSLPALIPQRRGSRTQSSVFNRIQAELEATPTRSTPIVLASVSDTSHTRPSQLNRTDPGILTFKPASHRQTLDGTPADSSPNKSFNSTPQSLAEDEVDIGCHTTVGLMEYPVLSRLSHSLERGCYLVDAPENTLGQGITLGVKPSKFRSDSQLCSGMVLGELETERQTNSIISLQSTGSVKDLIQAFQQQTDQHLAQQRGLIVPRPQQVCLPPALYLKHRGPLSRDDDGHRWPLPGDYVDVLPACVLCAPSTDVGSLSDGETVNRQHGHRSCQDGMDPSTTKPASEVVGPNANNNAMQMSDTDSSRTIDNSSVSSSIQVQPQNGLQEVAAAICASLDQRLNEEEADDYYFDDEISPNLMREKHMRLQTTMALDGSPAVNAGLTPLHASPSTESYTPLFSENGSGDSHHLVTNESSMEDLHERGLIPANKDTLTLTSVSPETLNADQRSNIIVSRDASNTLLIRKVIDGDTDAGTASSVCVESLQHGTQGLHTVTHRHMKLESREVRTTYHQTHTADKVVTRVISREKEGFDV